MCANLWIYLEYNFWREGKSLLNKLCTDKNRILSTASRWGLDSPWVQPSVSVAFRAPSLLHRWAHAWLRVVYFMMLGFLFPLLGENKPKKVKLCLLWQQKKKSARTLSNIHQSINCTWKPLCLIYMVLRIEYIYEPRFQCTLHWF